MATIIFHCGMPKTGSTAIQQYLHKFRLELEERKILYPVSGQFDGGHKHVAFTRSAIDNTSFLLPGMRHPDHTFDHYVANIKSELEESNASTAIISSEGLWIPSWFTESILARIKNAFAEHDLKILVYLREMPTHVNSSYAQRVTGPQRYAGSIAKHFRELEAIGMWNFRERLDTFSEVFGYNNVFVCRYEDVRGNLYKPLEALLHAELTHTPVQRVNVTRDWAYIRRRRLANWITASFNQRNNSVGKILVNLTYRAIQLVVPVPNGSPLSDQMATSIRTSGSVRMQSVIDRYDLTEWFAEKTPTVDH